VLSDEEDGGVIVLAIVADSSFAGEVRGEPDSSGGGASMDAVTGVLSTSGGIRCAACDVMGGAVINGDDSASNGTADGPSGSGRICFRSISAFFSCSAQLIRYADDEDNATAEIVDANAVVDADEDAELDAAAESDNRRCAYIGTGAPPARIGTAVDAGVTKLLMLLLPVTSVGVEASAISADEIGESWIVIAVSPLNSMTSSHASAAELVFAFDLLKNRSIEAPSGNVTLKK
jgi:hypothetical protein